VVHIGCMLRLVWRNFEQQRGSRLKREQTLGDGTLVFPLVLRVLISKRRRSSLKEGLAGATLSEEIHAHYYPARRQCP
ncbi:hypothetical protein, partial [Ventosimonas gracilis]|uniref:hypothetical protein n=1 Tax=Ventosimonas gracilis TaxID=1680762 RepID=UPI00195AF38A